MFKDINKYLSSTLKVYLFLLIVSFILKIVGADYFKIIDSSYFGIDLDQLINNHHLKNLWYSSTLIFYTYVTIAITLNKKNVIKETLIVFPIVYVMQHFKYLPVIACISPLYDLVYMYLICLIIHILTAPIFEIRRLTKRYILYNVLSIIIQFISLITRYKYSLNYNYGILVNTILNLDYFIMTLIIFYIHFNLKGVESIWIFQTEAFSFLQKKRHYSALREKLQRNLSSFKKLNKEEKLTYIFYFILSGLWNAFTLVMIIVIALLNKTLIECIFIVTSFWISKTMFGKPFHLKSMIQCFILSNFTYYVLNRITTPLGISMIIPVALGVGLSYITSKFVKKNRKLYKGMPLELFDELILKVEDKDSTKYNICLDYFVNKENAVFLGRKYNYSEAGIRKIADRVNKKVRES